MNTFSWEWWQAGILCDEDISILVCREEVMSVNPHTITSYLNWHIADTGNYGLNVLPFCIDAHHVVVPSWDLFTSMTLCYILFFLLERLTCVDAACTLSVAGSKCGAHKQGEWLIIGNTLFSSIHWCFIHRKCPHMSSANRNMESSTYGVTTECELKNGYDLDHKGILCPRTVASNTL